MAEKEEKMTTNLLDRKTIDLIGPLGAYPQLATALYDEVFTVGIPPAVGSIGDFHVSRDGGVTFYDPNSAPQIPLNVPIYVKVDYSIIQPVNYHVYLRFETDVMKDGIVLDHVVHEYDKLVPAGGIYDAIFFDFHQGMAEPGVYGLHISLFGQTIPFWI